jgi:hypothetical protein
MSGENAIRRTDTKLWDWIGSNKLRSSRFHDNLHAGFTRCSDLTPHANDVRSWIAWQWAPFLPPCFIKDLDDLISWDNGQVPEDDPPSARMTFDTHGKQACG